MLAFCQCCGPSLNDRELMAIIGYEDRSAGRGCQEFEIEPGRRGRSGGRAKALGSGARSLHGGYRGLGGLGLVWGAISFSASQK